MTGSVQTLVAGALDDLDAVEKLGDEELLATEWLWALRDQPSKVHDLTEPKLHSLLMEDLLLIASFEGKGRQLAQTIDGLGRFLDGEGKARVFRTCRFDPNIRLMIIADDNGRVRLDPRHIPEALRIIGVH